MEPLLETQPSKTTNEKFPREVILNNIKIQKLFAQPTLNFLKSLKLRNLSDENLSKYSREIGAYIYFFRIINTLTDESWIIRRPFKELVTLDKHIKKEAKKYKAKLQTPALPFTKDKLQDSPDQNLNFFEIYLNILINNSQTHVFESLSLFLEVSEVENEGRSQKYKEVYVHKRAGGRYNENQLLLRCGAFCKCWNKRYMIITSEGVMYSKGHLKVDSFIRENLLFDHHFKIQYGKQETGISKGLNLMYSNRKLHIEALDLFSFFDIVASLNEAFDNSPYIQENRFKSFAPVRENTYCKYYIDGEEYFQDVCDALLNSQNEVFITDWWLSPELFLKRPVSLTKNTETRIDRILKTIAEKGVLVKIIVYNEPKIALTIDSEHTQQSLQKLHANIAVLRHPGYILPTFLWSHHEKMIVIDQELGFLGGLDLCYGRMDTQKHSLFDHCEYESTQKDGFEIILTENEEFFPGIDYSNSRKKDFVNVRSYEKPLISKYETPRMPWHDIGVRIVGEAVTDMSRHFIQYWNFAKFNLEPTVKKKKLFTKKKSVPNNEPQLVGVEMENNETYMNKMKRKWTKFKINMGIIGEEKNKKPQENLIEKKQDADFVSFSPNQNENQIKIVKSQEIEKNNNKKELENPKFLIKSDFIPRKHPIGNTVYDIYAPKKADSDKIEVHIQKEIDSDRNNSEEKKDQIALQNENNDPGFSNEIATVKKNSLKNRNFIKSIATARPSEYLREPSYQTRIRSMSQSDRNKLDDFEKNPKFMMLLKEVQQAKMEMEEKADEDYMKTTKEMNLDKSQEIYQMSNSSQMQDSQKNRNEIPSKPITKLEKLKAFFSRDKAEIEKIRRKNTNENQNSQKSSFAENSENRVSLNKEGTIKFHHVKKHYETGEVKCQMLRSASLWSLGLKKENYESSIYIAYLALITNAANYIYIENQFFISSTAGAPVKNKIADALVSRIKKAALEKQDFKVFILMPLLPGFEGEINEPNSAVLKVQLHYEFLTLSRGGRSIIEELMKDPNITDPFQYISVFGLRNHALMPNNVPTTEIIYIHSKLLIVDDLFVIIGSANINDRSMLGNRDSEIAMLIEDNDLVAAKMNGYSCKVSKFAQTLRIKLFMEHFGLAVEELEDPLDQDVLQKIENNARRNTEIYRQVFRCYPDDEISCIGDYEKFKNCGDLEKYHELKNEIIGHAVSFPLKFLEKEDLQLTLKNKEYYIPNHNFT